MAQSLGKLMTIRLKGRLFLKTYGWLIMKSEIENENQLNQKGFQILKPFFNYAPLKQLGKLTFFFFLSHHH